MDLLAVALWRKICWYAGCFLIGATIMQIQIIRRKQRKERGE